jgi:hypothetical protein
VLSVNDDENKIPCDGFTELCEFARTRLKGQERSVIEAICSNNGELFIPDLAQMAGLKWEDSFKGFANVKQRLRSKLKSIHWTLIRHNNTAKLLPM